MLLVVMMMPLSSACMKLAMCYKLKILELVKRMNLILELTQENSIENSVQDCLSYILIPNDLCELFLAYPK